MRYNTKHGYPLTFVFHGAGGSYLQSLGWGLQLAPGAAQGGIFIFPQGINFQSYGIGWDDSASGYDMVFFDNMVAQIEASYCIDTSQVFVAGFSWGGDFVTSLGCHRGNVIRAAVANSTTDEFTQTANFRSYQQLPCPISAHPAVRFEHAAIGDSAYPAPDFASTSRLFQYYDHCLSTSTSLPSASSVSSCVQYNSCTKQMIECTFPTSWGHTLPPNWAADVWKYLSSFPSTVTP